MESEEEQFIRVMLSRKKAKTKSFMGKLIQKIGKPIGSGGGLYSLGSGRYFIRDNPVRYRRVVMKALIIKNKGSHWAERRQKHANYIQREGVGKEEEPVVAYGLEIGPLDVSDFIQRGREDAHEFRFIISAEDASQLDLSQFIRTVMKSLENDVGLKLDWMAVNHYNTDSPHTHIVLRGADKNGEKLILSRDMISHGIRNRASQIVTRELGQKSEQELQLEIERSVERKRAVPMDFSMAKRMDSSGLYVPQNDLLVQGVEVKTQPQLKRLQFLETFGLAEPIDAASWRLSFGFIDRLKELGFQGDIIKMMHPEVKVQEPSCVVYSQEIHGHKELVGVVVKRGVSDEMTEREFLVIQAQDSRYYYIDLDRYSDKLQVKKGDPVVVSLTQPKPFIKKSDFNLEAFAKTNAWVYDSKKHEAWAQSVGIRHGDYVKVHQDRVKFLESLDLAVKCGPQQWRLEPGFLKKLQAFEEEDKKRFIPRVHIRFNSVQPKHTLTQKLGMKP